MMIRQANKDDLEAICSIYITLFREMAELQPQYWNATEQNRDFLSNMIQGNDTAVFVAEKDGAVRGFALVAAQQTPPYACLKQYRYAYLMDMAVEPAYRGQGLGSRLIEQTKTWAREHQLAYLELGVLEENTAARKLYERQHFQTTMRTMRCKLS